MKGNFQKEKSLSFKWYIQQVDLLVVPYSLGYTYYTSDLTPFARNTKQHKQSETVYLSLSLSMGKSIECQCLGLTLSLPEFSWRVVHLWALLSLVLHVWHTSWCPRTILPNRTLQPPVRQEKWRRNSIAYQHLYQNILCRSVTFGLLFYIFPFLSYL